MNQNVNKKSSLKTRNLFVLNEVIFKDLQFYCAQYTNNKVSAKASYTAISGIEDIESSESKSVLSLFELHREFIES